MDFCKIPFGFGMALSMNFTAMNAYCAMTEAEQKAVLDKAGKAASQAEMTQLANSLAARR